MGLRLECASSGGASRKSKMVEVRPLGRSLETLGLVVDMTPEPAKSAGEAVAS